jgi:hypothetical protein
MTTHISAEQRLHFTDSNESAARSSKLMTIRHA